MAGESGSYGNADGNLLTEERRGGLFRFGGLAVVMSGVYLVAILVRVPSLLGQAAYAYALIEQSVLLALCTVAFFLAAKEQPTGEVKFFFVRVAVANLAWLAGIAVGLPSERALRPEVQLLIRDSLYAVYYVALLWAIEWAPGRSIRSRGERRLALSGSLILVVGSVTYIRILPMLAGRGDLDADSLVYAALDLYVAVRFLALALRNRKTRLSLVFGLLGVSGLCLTTADALQVAVAGGFTVVDEASLLALWWNALYVPLFLAARVRGVGRNGADTRIEPAGPLERLSLLWSPLIAYGFALPAVHVILYSTEESGGTVEIARSLFVGSWLVLLAVLIFIQRGAIARRVRASQTAQRELSDRIRALSAARESAVETERRRLSRDLHDGLGQLLVALQMELRWLSSHNEDDDTAISERLETASERVRQALDSSHHVATSLRPRVLDDFGLAAALSELVGRSGSVSGIDVRSIVDGVDTGLSAEAETALYRIAQATLEDCIAYSGARRIEIELTSDTDRVTLEVRDDGPKPGPGESPDWTIRGRLNARERAEAVGGELWVGAGIEGRGRSLRVMVRPADGRPAAVAQVEEHRRDQRGPEWRTR